MLVFALRKWEYAPQSVDEILERSMRVVLRDKAAKPRGRPARRVFINVSVRESSRAALNTLARRHSLTQGELLDQLLTGRIRV